MRDIFRRAADGQSCQQIADYLNRIGVPPVVQEVLRGKRKRRTTVIWQSSRIRNLLVNATYMGVHVYAKRRNVRDPDGHDHLVKNAPEQMITRPCPAIVDVDLWERANTAL